ncbi:MAG: hypothetical protein WAN81_04580 [Candidatus Binataceae bacterium]
MALTELPDGVSEIAGYLSRCCRFYSNVAPRQVLKKVLGTLAVVVDDDGTISLVCEKRSELIDQSVAVVWHANLLAELS